jgi:hypothetical protein
VLCIILSHYVLFQGKATRHKVEFDDGTKAILLLQKKGVTDTRRVEFELLEEAGADGIVAGGAQVSANRMTRQAIAKAKSMPDKQAKKTTTDFCTWL